MMEFVSWDDDIPNIWKNKNVPNHQSVMSFYVDKMGMLYGDDKIIYPLVICHIAKSKMASRNS